MFYLLLPGESPVQHIDGQHQTDVVPEPAGGPRHSRGNLEWAGSIPPSTAGAISAQGGHGRQRDGGELQVESGMTKNNNNGYSSQYDCFYLYRPD